MKKVRFDLGHAIHSSRGVLGFDVNSLVQDGERSRGQDFDCRGQGRNRFDLHRSVSETFTRDSLEPSTTAVAEYELVTLYRAPNFKRHPSSSSSSSSSSSDEDEDGLSPSKTTIKTPSWCCLNADFMDEIISVVDIASLRHSSPPPTQRQVQSDEDEVAATMADDGGKSYQVKPTYQRSLTAKYRPRRSKKSKLPRANKDLIKTPLPLEVGDCKNDLLASFLVTSQQSMYPQFADSLEDFKPGQRLHKTSVHVDIATQETRQKATLKAEQESTVLRRRIDRCFQPMISKPSVDSVPETGSRQGKKKVKINKSAIFGCYMTSPSTLGVTRRQREVEKEKVEEEVDVEEEESKSLENGDLQKYWMRQYGNQESGSGLSFQRLFSLHKRKGNKDISDLSAIQQRDSKLKVPIIKRILKWGCNDKTEGKPSEREYQVKPKFDRERVIINRRRYETESPTSDGKWRMDRKGRYVFEPDEREDEPRSSSDSVESSESLPSSDSPPRIKIPDSDEAFCGSRCSGDNWRSTFTDEILDLTANADSEVVVPLEVPRNCPAQQEQSTRQSEANDKKMTLPVKPEAPSTSTYPDTRSSFFNSRRRSSQTSQSPRIEKVKDAPARKGFLSSLCSRLKGKETLPANTACSRRWRVKKDPYKFTPRAYNF